MTTIRAIVHPKQNIINLYKTSLTLVIARVINVYYRFWVLGTNWRNFDCGELNIGIKEANPKTWGILGNHDTKPTTNLLIYIMGNIKVSPIVSDCISSTPISLECFLEQLTKVNDTLLPCFASLLPIIWYIFCVIHLSWLKIKSLCSCQMTHMMKFEPLYQGPWTTPSKILISKSHKKYIYIFLMY